MRLMLIFSLFMSDYFERLGDIFGLITRSHCSSQTSDPIYFFVKPSNPQLMADLCGLHPLQKS